MKEVFAASLEMSATYNVAVLQDDLVKLQLRASTFQLNLNRFQFKYPVLQRQHTNAFGETIPAYKSFERQLVNRNHNMADANPRARNEPIGFIERSELRDDGVYLTVWIWKRALSESELSGTSARRSQSQHGKCEYTEPRIRYLDGTEHPLQPGTGVSGRKCQ
ncbi:MAG: hypothetical protein MZV70_29115 [Desulfobacterales bacterium]|nr:hypothetical protein [Desulfobacterales bacterium]